MHLRHEFWDSEGLGDHLIHSSVERSMNLLWASIRSNSDDRDVFVDHPFLLTLADLFDTGQTIHGRHFQLIKVSIWFIAIVVRVARTSRRMIDSGIAAE